jgi:sugar phosphate isomerase/epimerase
MSAGCVYPLSVDDAFRLSAAAGYDGVEVMVTNDKTTQSADALLALAEEHGQPILSVHAPVLLLTHFVWGRDPQVKLEKSAELAAAVGASLIAFIIVYFTLFGLGTFYILRLMNKPPQDHETGLATDEPIRASGLFPVLDINGGTENA